MAEDSTEIPVIRIGGSEVTQGINVERATITFEVSTHTSGPYVQVHTANGLEGQRSLYTEILPGGEVRRSFILEYPKSQEQPKDASSPQQYRNGDIKLLTEALRQERELSRFLLQRIAHYTNKQHGLEKGDKESGVGPQGSRPEAYLWASTVGDELSAGNTFYYVGPQGKDDD